MMKINYSKVFIFLTGMLVGFILFIVHNWPSSHILYQWRNQSHTIMLSVVNHGWDFPFGSYHRFGLTPVIHGKLIPRGYFLVVDDNFSDYENLKVEWLKDGCLITSKNGYKIFMPYP